MDLGRRAPGGRRSSELEPPRTFSTPMRHTAVRARVARSFPQVLEQPLQLERASPETSPKTTGRPPLLERESPGTFPQALKKQAPDTDRPPLFVLAQPRVSQEELMRSTPGEKRPTPSDLESPRPGSTGLGQPRPAPPELERPSPSWRGTTIPAPVQSTGEQPKIFTTRTRIARGGNRGGGSSDGGGAGRANVANLADIDGPLNRCSSGALGTHSPYRCQWTCRIL